MALEFWEILVAGVLLLFFFRPKTVVDAARSWGKTVTALRKPTNASQADKTKSTYGSIVEVAKSLGIRTEGKTAKQLSDEIVAKAGRASKS